MGVGAAANLKLFSIVNTVLAGRVHSLHITEEIIPKVVVNELGDVHWPLPRSRRRWRTFSAVYWRTAIIYPTSASPVIIPGRAVGRDRRPLWAWRRQQDFGMKHGGPELA